MKASMYFIFNKKITLYFTESYVCPRKADDIVPDIVFLCDLGGPIGVTEVGNIRVPVAQLPTHHLTQSEIRGEHVCMLTRLEADIC